MNAPKDRTLLVIADAHFRVGLILFLCAAVITGSALYQYGPEDADKLTVDEDVTVPLLPDDRPEDAVYMRGEKLFKQNCASCHKPDKNMTGPALKGSKDRWAQSGGDIYAWIKNSQGYLASSGDTEAKRLFEEYNKSVMTPNAVSNEDIDAILYFVDHYAPPAAVPKYAPAIPRKAGSDQQLGYIAR